MSSLNDHTERWRTHQQPRRVDYHRDGFVRPPDREPAYECPRCCHVAPWTDGRTAAAGDPYDEFWCQNCGEETPLADLMGWPLTPADPHPHAWADLGTPGLHGSVCRLCGETQID